MAMLIPLLQYRITRQEKYFENCFTYGIKKEVLDEDTINILKDSFDHVKIKVAMRTNIDEKKVKRLLLAHIDNYVITRNE